MISQQELAEPAAQYKSIAGYAVDATNSAPDTIAPGARLLDPQATR